ncbi:KilA-N domain-containing protein [Saprospiraceae bacterium]|nr:KilA-N domain-containing protein [Saprospiraceae bacterium]
MAKQKTLSVQGIEIRYYQQKEEDFISLTDIGKKFNSRADQLISNWLRTRATVNFLGAWESLHNPSFNSLNFEGIKNQTGEPTFVLSVSDWVSQTGAVGIRAKAGRYGGTYAHMDIAFEFLSYLSPTFKLYVFKEFQRLKLIEAEEQKKTLKWDLKRTLAKVNYIFHTDAVKEYLVPARIYNTKKEGVYYASEADLLNVALFGMTAKEWRLANPDKKGNMRDYASAEQLLVLANLENLNAEFIKQGMSQNDRLVRLNEIAIHQMSLLVNVPAMKNLDKGKKK